MASANLFLHGAMVTRDFREALFEAANRAGVTPNEFCIVAAAEKLAKNGANFPVCQLEGLRLRRTEPRYREGSLMLAFPDIARRTWDEYRMREGFSGISTRVDGSFERRSSRVPPPAC